jgi:4-amino-4-deoxy-L-arabinose transferase-like glycosyltransferase
LALLHRWAAVIWPQDAAAALILLAACAVLAIGLWRQRRSFGRFVPSLLLVAVCELWVLIADLSCRPLSAWWPLGAVACVLLAIHLVAGREAGLAPGAAPGRAPGRGYLVVGGLVTCALLGFRLASSPGQLLIWEPPVIEGFGGALREGHGAVDFLRATLLWDEGLVSRGDHSLLYGAPTYAILLHAGFGVAQLRIVAALLAAAAVMVTFLLARRFGGGAATGAALALALSPPLLFYGRYGTSLSGTLLGALLATWACWGLLAAPARQWWRGLVAALALIVATLGYSPGRLVVLALLAVTVAFTVAKLRTEGRRLLGLVLLAAALAGFWAYQARWGADRSFLNARGEQIVNMMRQPGYLQSFLHRPASDEPRTLATWIDVAGTLVAQRAPEYLSALGAPFGRQVHFDKVVFFDPPRLPLFIAPLLPFLLLGLAASLRGVRRPEHSTLLGWLLLTTLPLLLTTRVDAHRMVLLVVPFALWTAFGVVGAVAALDEARVGRRPRQAVGVVLIGLVAWLNVVAIFPVDPRSPVQSPAMIAELAGLRGEVVLVSIADQRDLGLVDLALLERQRRDPGSRGRLLPDEKVRALVDGAAVDPARISELVAEVGTGTVLMVPAGAFSGTAEALRDAGLEVSERGPRGARFWRAARPAAAPGV